MKAVIQRVQSSSLHINGELFSEIKRGFLVLLGIGKDDTEKEAELLCDRILKLRVFSDENDKMNLSLMDAHVQGGLQIVSNFTLYANCKKSRRPDFLNAAKPESAERLYEYFLACMLYKAKALVSADATLVMPEIKSGVFGADMKITLVNDGPVTLILDTDEMTH